MAQQLIEIGENNQGEGDTLPVCFTKTNENFTELFDSLEGGNNTVYLYSEADLPNKTATTWTMESNTPYKIAASFSTSLQCLPSGGSSLRGDNLGAYTLTYTGTLPAFFGDNVDFYVNNIAINTGSATAFEFSDSTGLTHRFIAENVQVNQCGLWGKFSNMALVQVNNSNGLNATNGIEFVGTNAIWSVDKFALVSSSNSFTGLNLGTATANTCEFTDLTMIAPSGAVGISGLSNSGNIPVGRLATVQNGDFSGGIIDLSGINVSNDSRWKFLGNTPTQDTQATALISFSGNTTETTINTINTPELVSGLWVESSSSLFTTTSAGRVTANLERPSSYQATVSAGLISASGGSIQATAYLALNGSVIPESATRIEISGSTAQTLSIPWLVSLSQNDYLEVKVENNSNTTNIIVESAVLRVI